MANVGIGIPYDVYRFSGAVTDPEGCLTSATTSVFPSIITYSGAGFDYDYEARSGTIIQRKVTAPDFVDYVARNTDLKTCDLVLNVLSTDGLAALTATVVGNSTKQFSIPPLPTFLVSSVSSLILPPSITSTAATTSSDAQTAPRPSASTVSRTSSLAPTAPQTTTLISSVSSELTSGTQAPNTQSAASRKTSVDPSAPGLGSTETSAQATTSVGISSGATGSVDILPPTTSAAGASTPPTESALTQSGISKSAVASVKSQTQGQKPPDNSLTTPAESGSSVLRTGDAGSPDSFTNPSTATPFVSKDLSSSAPNALGILASADLASSTLGLAPTSKASGDASPNAPLTGLNVGGSSSQPIGAADSVSTIAQSTSVMPFSDVPQLPSVISSTGNIDSTRASPVFISEGITTPIAPALTNEGGRSIADTSFDGNTLASDDSTTTRAPSGDATTPIAEALSIGGSQRMAATSSEGNTLVSDDSTIARAPSSSGSFLATGETGQGVAVSQLGEPVTGAEGSRVTTSASGTTPKTTDLGQYTLATSGGKSFAPTTSSGSLSELRTASLTTNLEGQTVVVAQGSSFASSTPDEAPYSFFEQASLTTNALGQTAALIHGSTYALGTGGSPGESSRTSTITDATGNAVTASAGSFQSLNAPDVANGDSQTSSSPALVTKSQARQSPAIFDGSNSALVTSDGTRAGTFPTTLIVTDASGQALAVSNGATYSIGTTAGAGTSTAAAAASVIAGAVGNGSGTANISNYALNIYTATYNETRTVKPRLSSTEAMSGHSTSYTGAAAGFGPSQLYCTVALWLWCALVCFQ